jgi:hypothetical protein
MRGRFTALPCQATAASPVPTSCAAAPRDWGRPSTTGSPPSRVSGGRASAPPWLGTDRQWNSARMLTVRPHVGPARGGVVQMLQMLNLDVADVIFPCCNLHIWMFHCGDWAAPGRRPLACLGSSLCPPPPAVGHQTPAKLRSDARSAAPRRSCLGCHCSDVANAESRCCRCYFSMVQSPRLNVSPCYRCCNS